MLPAEDINHKDTKIKQNEEKSHGADQETYAVENIYRCDFLAATVTMQATQDNDSEIGIIPVIESIDTHPQSERTIIVKEKVYVLEVGDAVICNEDVFAEEFTCLDEILQAEYFEGLFHKSSQDSFEGVILQLPLTEEQTLQSQLFCQEEKEMKIQPHNTDDVGTLSMFLASEFERQVKEAAKSLHGMFMVQFAMLIRNAICCSGEGLIFALFGKWSSFEQS